MRVIASADGRRRIWYRDDEIERRTSDELIAASVMPQPPAVRVDIEALIEGHLGALVDYGVDLPPQLLGFTEFTKPPRIGISRVLTDAATRPDALPAILGRWRATLAHEAAHVLFHAPLYAPLEAEPGRPNSQPIRCSRATLEGLNPGTDWREVQANKGMGALLMPKTLFEARAAAAFEARGRFVPPVSAAEDAIEPIVRLLASAFEVSMQAARIRLHVLGFVETG
jgi:hypothetical protein